MESCVWILLSSHGLVVTTLNLFQVAFCIVCLLVSFWFTWRIASTERRNATSKKSSLSKLDCSRQLFGKLKIVTPVIFGLSANFEFLTHLIAIHHANPLHAGWMAHVENVCKFKLLSADAIISITALTLTYGSFFALSYLYFTRFVTVFHDSVFSISDKIRMVINGALSFGMLLIMGNIVIFFFSRFLGLIALGLGFVTFAVISIFFQWLLATQLKAVIGFGEHGEKYKPVLIRLTVLFIVSMVTTTILVVVYNTLLAIGIYPASVEVRCVVTIMSEADKLVNMLCVALQLQQFGSLYQLLCQKCDKKCSEKYQTKAIVAAVNKSILDDHSSKSKKSKKSNSHPHVDSNSQTISAQSVKMQVK